MHLVLLALLAAGYAAEGLRLPEGEEAFLWAPALEGTGLELVEEGGRIQVEVGHRLWRVVVADGDGPSREVLVVPPTTASDRQDVVYLALSLLVPLPEPAWPSPDGLGLPPVEEAPEVPVEFFASSAVVEEPPIEVLPPPPPVEPEPAPEPPVAEVVEPSPPPIPLPTAPTPAVVQPVIPAPSPGPWLEVAATAAWTGGNRPCLRMQVAGGVPVLSWLSMAGGAVGASPVTFDEEHPERSWWEIGGMLGPRAVFGVASALVALELTRRSFPEAIHSPAVGVPSLAIQLSGRLEQDRRLAAYPQLGARLDLRPIEWGEQGVDEGTPLPRWGLHAGVAVQLGSWRR